MSLPPPPSPSGQSAPEPASPRLRPSIELAGGLLVGAALVAEIGAVTAAADSGFDDSVSVGDFFAAVGIFQLFVVAFVVLGALLSAPRMLVTTRHTPPTGAGRLVIGAALIISAAAVVFAAGSTITSLTRISDDELGATAGDWLLGAGALLGAAAAVVVSFVALTATDARQAARAD